MKKRKLPSAIRPTSDDRAAAGARLTVQYEAPAPPATTGKEQAAAPKSGRAIETIEANRKDSRGAAIASLAAPARASLVGDERRSQALAIVQRYSAFSAAGGIIPLPIANLASVTALNVYMVKRLSDLYGVPYRRDRARAMVVGLLGGVMPSGLGMVTASTLGVLVPVSGLIGLAVSSVSALACTRGIGQTLIEHFESGKTLHEFPLIKWPGFLARPQQPR